MNHMKDFYDVTLVSEDKERNDDEVSMIGELFFDVTREIE